MTTVVENWDIAWLRTMFDHEQSRLVRRLALERVWRSTVSPTDALPRDEWVRMFRQVGYFDAMNVEPTPLPARLRLYRGAVDLAERLLSWTDDPRVARQYGTAVWTCEVPREAVLATLPLILSTAPYAPTHAEFVVDVPHDVTVTEASAVTLGGATITARFSGETPSAVHGTVRRFLREVGLDRMRPSALGWTADDSRVTFYGAEPVILEIARRHPAWAVR